MTNFYILTILLAILIAYAGLEETLKIVYYIELQIKITYIKMISLPIKWKLEKDLDIPRNYLKDICSVVDRS